MKKLILIAVSALAVFSCTKSDKVYMESEIAFTPVPTTITKGTGAIDDATYPEGETFGVWAYRTDEAKGTEYSNTLTVEDWITNIEFKKNGTTWKGQPAQYWPNTGSLFFAALHPFTVASTYTCAYSYGDHRLTVNNFVQGTNYNYVKESNPMVDLMWFDVNETGTTSESKTVVPRTFHHALSWITVNVKAKESTDEDLYQLTSLTLEAVDEQGTFTSDNKAWATSSAKSINLLAGYTPAGLTTTATSFDNVLLLPQTLDNTNKLVIKFKQKRNSSDTFEHAPEQSVEFDLSAYADSEWKLQHHYTYNIDFHMSEIEITPKVDDNWTEKTINNIPTI